MHTCSEKDVAGSGVPADDAHAFGVALQYHNGLADGPGWSVVWDLPYLQKKMRELIVVN